jgi:hypothetical protein
MGDWNLGSVGAEVLLLVENVPDNISGALPRIADRQRNKVEEYTGVTIGSNAIGIKYQEAILQLTIAKTASDMQSYGTDASEVKLGDFTVKKGSDSNLQVIAQNAKNAAESELNCLGKNIKYYKANG